MLFTQQPGRLFALAILLASSPPTHAGYVRPQALQARASSSSYVCNNPAQASGCPDEYIATSSSSTETNCSDIGGNYDCQYNASGQLNTDASSTECPASAYPRGTLCEPAEGGDYYPCQNPVTTGGVTTCTNMARRNGMSRSPEWVKKRQAKVKRASVRTLKASPAY